MIPLGALGQGPGWDVGSGVMMPGLPEASSFSSLRVSETLNLNTLDYTMKPPIWHMNLKPFQG